MPARRVRRPPADPPRTLSQAGTQVMTEQTLAADPAAEADAADGAGIVTSTEQSTKDLASGGQPVLAETPAAAAPAVEAASKLDDEPVVADPFATDAAVAQSAAAKEAATKKAAASTIAADPGSEDETGEDPDEPAMHWYVLKVASNRETTIKRVLERDIKREALEEHFGEILIPTEKVKETKNGKTRVRSVKLWPGYLVVQMRIIDDTYHLVRSVTGVGDFTGAAGKPVPMTDDEVSRLKGEEVKKEEAAEKGEEPVVVKVPFDEGQRVKVKEGPFENFEGTVETIDQHTGKIKILVEIFGRPTEMELEHWQVEKL